MENEKDTFWEDLGKDNAAASLLQAQKEASAREHMTGVDARIAKTKVGVREAFEQIRARLQNKGCKVAREWAKGTNETVGLYILVPSLPYRLLLKAEVQAHGGILVSVLEEEAGDKRREFAYPPQAISVAAMVAAFDSAFRTVVGLRRREMNSTTATSAF
jgi:hypothetical protein